MKNNDDECFHYAVTVALNHEKNVKDWKGINFPSYVKDWKKFESNNKSIARIVLFIENDKDEIKQAYVSKHSSELENKVILLMITDGEKWHYLAIKKTISVITKNNIKA